MAAASPASPTAPSGQVLVIVALLLVGLLGFAGIAIDLGRQSAERRYVQTAADAGALAACRSLVAGDTDATAAQAARDVAMINLTNSPAGASATIADDASRVYEDGHAGDPEYLESGIIVSGSTVRVAIESALETVLARVVGVTQLETGARARCGLEGEPAIPIVARRYVNPSGPGNGFVDHLATEATSGSGQVDSVDPRGYGVRSPASEAAKGPLFALYGTDSKANNDSSFRGFIALDVRNFETSSSRVYYNGVTAGTTDNTLKDKEGAYLRTGYPGPGFPPVAAPPTGDTQVAVLSGNSTAFVVQRFDDAYDPGDRILLGVYNGSVLEIPDFSITPPPVITLPATTSSPTDGPSFTVSRNNDFSSTVTLHLHGDAAAADPAFDILPDPPVTPPAAGDMDQPTWSTDVFLPSKHGTTVEMRDISTNAVPAGIYTVWLEGHSGDPYYQKRRYPVAVRIGGAVRDFSLDDSTLDGTTPTLGGTINLPILVTTTNASATRWGATGSPVSLSWDTSSFSTCSLAPASLGTATIALSSSSVTPTSAGASSTLTITTTGLAQGCYSFVLRGTGTNGDGQPVTHLETVTFTVATVSSTGQYVDIIGFAVFQIEAPIGANDIYARAVTGIHANPNAYELRRAQRPRLVPWT